MLSDFAEKKETFVARKKDNLLKSKNPMLLVKKFQFFVYLDFVKISLEIMLNDFAGKKRNLFWP